VKGEQALAASRKPQPASRRHVAGVRRHAASHRQYDSSPLPAFARRAWRLFAFLLVPFALCICVATDSRAQDASAAAHPQQTAHAPAAQSATAASTTPAATSAVAPSGVTTPADYTIGPDDVLTVTIWREKDMSADVVVRPDGRITLPLLNDIQAQGLTPDGLRARVTEAASKFVEDPSVTVVVKQINSRKVFVTGMVGRPGPYPLSAPTTVLQLLSIAGGVNEFADTKKILIMRTEDGVQKALKFNYKDVIRGKNLKQNILLKPGDTIVVP
jgi:polysaccharide export outer membrane protein